MGAKTAFEQLLLLKAACHVIGLEEAELDFEIVEWKDPDGRGSLVSEPKINFGRAYARLERELGPRGLLRRRRKPSSVLGYTFLESTSEEDFARRLIRDLQLTGLVGKMQVADGK